MLGLVTEASLPLAETGDFAIHLPDQHTSEQGELPSDIQPLDLGKILDLNVPDKAGGRTSFEENLNKILKHSVNTWSQGFLQKLYGSTDPPGVASELILAFLNQNVHVYEAAPALTLVEKFVTRKLAGLFGLNGPESGGITVQGGSASNTTSIVIARNTLFPNTKTGQ